MKQEKVIVGVIIAGGTAQRIGGGDKCLLEIEGRSILNMIIDRVAPQVDHLIINANGNLERFDFTGLSIVPDDKTFEQQGPLCGIYSAMMWVKKNIPSENVFLACFPSDTPFIPDDLVSLLKTHQSKETDIVCPISGGDMHPIFSLIPVSLCDDILKFTAESKHRAVRKWLSRHEISYVSFNDKKYSHAFLNINTMNDLETARNLQKDQIVYKKTCCF